MLEEICKKYNNEIKEILDALQYASYEDLDEYNFENEVIYPFEEKYKKDYGWNNGASKGVLIFKDMNFVIKIPFSQIDGEYLCGAEEANEEWNYCSQEENRYLLAKKYGLQSIFLETTQIGTIKGYPIYIQLFAEPLENIPLGYSMSTKDDKKIVEMIIAENNFEEIDNEWEADIFAMYGGKYYHKFKNFILENNIDDLRSSNIGYVGLYPVIFDYAGFFY